MNTWYYGYTDNSGLVSIKEDPETIAVELFYDGEVKKEVSDDKKKDLWSLSNRTHKEKENNGVVFQVYFPDEDKAALLAIKESDPKAAMKMLHEKSIHIDLCTHGTTVGVAHGKWNFICGVTSQLEVMPEPVEEKISE